jgi:hypothetical protein
MELAEDERQLQEELGIRPDQMSPGMREFYDRKLALKRGTIYVEVTFPNGLTTEEKDEINVRLGESFQLIVSDVLKGGYEYKKK